MNKNTFPTLLATKATMFGGLTRIDLCTAGGAHIIFSLLDLSGIVSLLAIVALLLTLRRLRRLLPKGFFSHLNDPVLLPWAERLKEAKE